MAPYTPRQTGGAQPWNGAEERPVSRARQAERPHFDGTASSDVLDATACGGGGGGGDGGIALSPVRSTPWRDPETRGAMPRAGLRRHALAARLADLLLSCNNKKPPKKAAPKTAPTSSCH